MSGQLNISPSQFSIAATTTAQLAGGSLAPLTTDRINGVSAQSPTSGWQSSGASGSVTTAAGTGATANLPTTASAAKPVGLVDQLRSAIAAQAESAPANGKVEFRLRLDPPELGTVHVQLTLRDQTVSARLIVHDASSRQLVQSQLDSLRQKLQDTGLTLGQVDVSGQGAQNSSQQQQSLPTSAVSSGDTVASAAATTVTSPVSPGSGRVDVMV